MRYVLLHTYLEPRRNPCSILWKVKNSKNFDGCRHSSAPLYQQVFRWFREVHKLEGLVSRANNYDSFKLSINIYLSEGKENVVDEMEFKNYEEAQIACVRTLIEILNSRK